MMWKGGRRHRGNGSDRDIRNRSDPLLLLQLRKPMRRFSVRREAVTRPLLKRLGSKCGITGLEWNLSVPRWSPGRHRNSCLMKK